MKFWLTLSLALLVPSLEAKTVVKVKAGLFDVSANFEGEDAQKFFRALAFQVNTSAGDSGTGPISKLGDLIVHKKVHENGNRGSDLYTSIECNDEIFRKTGKRFRTHCEMHVETPTPKDNTGYIIRSSKSPLAKNLYDGMEKDAEEKTVDSPPGKLTWTERALKTSDKKAVFVCTQSAHVPSGDPEGYQCFTHIIVEK